MTRKRILAIENCKTDCKYHYWRFLSQKFKHYCEHPEFKNSKSPQIHLSKLTNKRPFSEWCPLAEEREEPKYTFTLNCDECGDAYTSEFAFPVNQLCPSCEYKKTQ